MKFIILFGLLILFAQCTQKTAQGQNKHQADLEQLYKALKEIHPGVYRYTPQSVLDKKYESIRQILTTQTTDWEFYRLASELVETVKCGHTRLNPADAMMREVAESGKLFPLPVQFIDSLMFVRLPDGSVAEAITINQVPISEISNTILARFPTDGAAQQAKFDIMSTTFARYYGKYINHQVPKFDIGVRRLQSNQTEQVLVDPIRANETGNKSFFKPLSERPIEFKMLNGVAYLRVETFGSDSYSSAGIDYYDMLENTFNEIRTQKIDRLIVDIRGNGGGADEYGAQLCRYLLTKPFHYFKTVKQKSGNGFSSVGHSCLAEQQPMKNAFPGKVFLLVDGLTFSTAADVASVFKSNNRGEVWGRETGGGYEGNTSGPSERIRLENSQITIVIPKWYYENDVVLQQPLHRGVIPTQKVNPTLESLVSGDDSVLKTAVEQIQKK